MHLWILGVTDHQLNDRLWLLKHYCEQNLTSGEGFGMVSTCDNSTTAVMYQIISWQAIM